MRALPLLVLLMFGCDQATPITRVVVRDTTTGSYFEGPTLASVGIRMEDPNAEFTHVGRRDGTRLECSLSALGAGGGVRVSFGCWHVTGSDDPGSRSQISAECSHHDVILYTHISPGRRGGDTAEFSITCE